jgi:hypothetical protein
MQKRMMPFLAMGILAAGLVSLAPGAQVASPRGVLHGIVTDPSGAVIPEAVVMVSSERTSETVVTDETGQYAVAGLTPDHYRVQVHAPGFAPFSKSGFVVSAGHQTEADAQLVIRVPKQEITVTD